MSLTQRVQSTLHHNQRPPQCQFASRALGKPLAAVAWNHKAWLTGEHITLNGEPKTARKYSKTVAPTTKTIASGLLQRARLTTKNTEKRSWRKAGPSVQWLSPTTGNAVNQIQPSMQQSGRRTTLQTKIGMRNNTQIGERRIQKRIAFTKPLDVAECVAAPLRLVTTPILPRYIAVLRWGKTFGAIYAAAVFQKAVATLITLCRWQGVARIIQATLQFVVAGVINRNTPNFHRSSAFFSKPLTNGDTGNV